MCEKCRLMELFDEELARFESGEAFSIARRRYALERRGISEGRAMVIAHSEPFQGPTPPSREEMKTWPEIAQESGLPCGIVACPQCGKVISGYLAPDLVCVCGYKFFERKEES